MRDTRLLMASIDAPPRVGGIATFAHECAQVFAGRCAETVFIGPHGAGSGLSGAASYRLANDPRKRTAAHSGPAYLRDLPRLTRIFLDAIDRYAINRILLFHPFFYGPAAMRAARARGLDYEVVVHGTELTSQFPCTVEGNANLPATAVDGRPFQLYSTLANARRVHANSRFTSDIARTIAPGPTHSVCGCGIARNTFERLARAHSPDLAEKRRLRETLGWAVQPVQLCFIGRLVEHKRVDRILTLLQHLPATLKVVGDGPCRPDLEARARSLGIADKVHFLGTTDEALKWQVLAASDACLLASGLSRANFGYEGFGIVLLEAVAAGTLAFASGSEGLRDPLELYGIGLEGLGDRVDTAATAAALNEMLACETTYRRKLETDREIVKARLLWDHVAGRIGADWHD